jgi:hypothetical protein
MDYNVVIEEELSNAVGALTQKAVNILFDKQITRNTIKTITTEPGADDNGEKNNL